MSQLTYTEKAASFFAGMLADPNANAYIKGDLANEDAALAKFGLGYMLGTDPEKQFKLPAGAGVFAGVLTHQHATEKRALFTAGGAGGATGIQQDEPGLIVKVGRVVVEVDEAVTAGDAAFVRHTTSDFGKFRQDNAAGAAQAVNGVFESTTSGAGLAVLNLNEP